MWFTDPSGIPDYGWMIPVKMGIIKTAPVIDKKFPCSQK